ncbi:MAG: fructose-specific PTS transporter subunit EIIC [Spirochaetota bacterium]|nr:fructose-specific PTS transporter subunit EIIC [Spirochaetota bacterium]
MKHSLHNLISSDLIFLDQLFNNKKAFVQYASEILVQKGLCTDSKQFYKDVLNRESLSSTDFEEGIAIPHAKSSAISKVSIVITTLKNKWKNTEGQNPISVAFLLAIPKEANDEHIEILSKLSVLLLKKGFIEKLNSTSSTEEFINILTKFETSDNINTSNELPQIVAVTACPIGVAHTYVAAQKLRDMAQELNISIKVETQGSIGIENKLTKADIESAKTVILACDKAIDKSRFVGKIIIECSVKKPITNSKELLQDALQQKGILLESSSGSSSSSSEDKTPFYRYLMGGVSAIIPVVVVGGVYIALAIAMSGVEVGTGVNITNPLLQKMEQVGGLAFGLMIPILAGFIAMSIADKPGLIPGMVGGALAAQLGAGFLGGILAGFLAGFFVSKLVKIKLPQNLMAIMPIFIIPLVGTGLTVATLYIIGSPIKGFMDSMTLFLQNMQGSAVLLGAIIGAMIAFDMGGPVNKVAFLFGVSMIQSGVPEIMGMVAVAVCIPPLGIWLATQIRPVLFDKQEREAGNAALIMGMIGITEGAIPFAVANPIRVIPALMTGSMVGGMLAGLWKVGDYAPHGGPIVLPVVNNPIGFIIAILVGTTVTALTLIFLLSQQQNKKAQNI